MAISKITLSSFRNYDQKALEINEGLTVIWGENGSGKTSLLEAIHTLSYGKSFKTSRQKELIKSGSVSYVVRGVFIKSGSNETINTEYGIKGIQKTKINGKLITNRKEQIRRNPVVILSPEEQEITKGGPAERRRFFDRVFSVVSTDYLNTLQAYIKILKQRNALLIRARDEKTQNGEILSWDKQLATAASSLCAQRKAMLEEYVSVLNYLQDHYEEDVQIGIKYKPNLKDSNEYLSLLSKTKDTDILFGRTTRGPHKDDMEMFWCGAKTRTVGSQGEHKISLVFLKLAEMLFVKEKVGRFPILLLDDLFAKLDLGRSKKLVNLINKLEIETNTPIQTIITTTDILNIEQSGILNSGQNVTNHHLTR